MVNVITVECIINNNPINALATSRFHVSSNLKRVSKITIPIVDIRSETIHKDLGRQDSYQYPNRSVLGSVILNRNGTSKSKISFFHPSGEHLVKIYGVRETVNIQTRNAAVNGLVGCCAAKFDLFKGSIPELKMQNEKYFRTRLFKENEIQELQTMVVGRMYMTSNRDFIIVRTNDITYGVYFINYLKVRGFIDQ